MEPLRSLRTQRGRVVVARMPTEIDVANAMEVSLAILAALDAAQVVVADMTGTRFCDCSGVRAILHGCGKAEARGAELRLALSAPLVRLVFKLTDADRLVSIYPDVVAAAGTPSAATPTRMHQPLPHGASVAGS